MLRQIKRRRDNLVTREVLNSVRRRAALRAARARRRRKADSFAIEADNRDLKLPPLGPGSAVEIQNAARLRVFNLIIDDLKASNGAAAIIASAEGALQGAAAFLFEYVTPQATAAYLRRLAQAVEALGASARGPLH